MGLVQNLGWRTGQYKFIHHFAAQKARVFDLAVKLAIGEGACAAFAKLNIAFGVERVLAPQAPGVFGPLAHGLTALQYDGAKAHLGQRQRGKHAAGSKTHHHGPVLQIRWRLRHWAVGHIGRGADVGVVGKLRQQGRVRRWVCQRDVGDIHR